ncbi:MAG TPA: hypothetical protein VFY10_12165 [Dehalococcoidia bacterium]|nr:hypothetical protein [Dehalococcoidia bacterium]
MVEWPGKCGTCKQPIVDWGDAGYFDKSWIHKTCFRDRLTTGRAKTSEGAEVPELRSPVDRQSQLELPMLVFLLMFHFGLGAAVGGWLMIDQHQSQSTGALLMAIGIIVPLIGIGGVAINIISRRHIETIRQALDTAGGWRPGR